MKKKTNKKTKKNKQKTLTQVMVLNHSAIWKGPWSAAASDGGKRAGLCRRAMFVSPHPSLVMA